jgi:hypothetical protein
VAYAFFSGGGPSRDVCIRAGSEHVGKALYFLEDDAHGQWCGYASEAQFKAQVQPLRAMVVGRVDYTDGRVSKVGVTETDETGDWAVNDEYVINGAGKIQSLKRTINIIPENLAEDQFFLIENGKAVRQRAYSRDLRTGKPTQRSASWFEPPPIVKSLQAFPFSALIVGGQRPVQPDGAFCVPQGSR